MRTTRRTPLRQIALAAALILTSTVHAQEATIEWEYLVVTYGETLFANPLLDVDGTSSKVQMFSGLGVTIPMEAVNLQQNIDALGQHGWELVAIVGAIGGDQQLVFKRPYDAQRSAEEADRIRAEREQLLAAYEAAQDEEGPTLIDLDAVERAQATRDRNTRDANRVRTLLQAAANATGHDLNITSAEGLASMPTGRPRVYVQAVLDVTDSALIAPGQYRSSLVNKALQDLRFDLIENGLTAPSANGCTGPGAGRVTLLVTATIQHDDAPIEVGSAVRDHCFTPEG